MAEPETTGPMTDLPEFAEAVAMSSTVTSQLPDIRDMLHPGCVVCGKGNLRGLKVDFVSCDDGSVIGLFRGDATLQGYSGVLHGGIIAALLDGAMTNCLFAHKICAVTAELNVRYHDPVFADKAVLLSASISRSAHHLHVMQAALKQEGKVKAEAVGRFMPGHSEECKNLNKGET